MSQAFPKISIELTPAFHDLDPLEIVWHGNYAKYFELARTALMQDIGYDYPNMRNFGYSWPVVELQLKYVRPAVYGQRLRIHATLREWRNRIKINYLIEDVQTGVTLTRGHSIQAAVEIATGRLQFVSPAVLVEKMDALLAERAAAQAG